MGAAGGMSRICVPHDAQIPCMEPVVPPLLAAVLRVVVLLLPRQLVSVLVLNVKNTVTGVPAALTVPEELIPVVELKVVPPPNPDEVDDDELAAVVVPDNAFPSQSVSRTP